MKKTSRMLLSGFLLLVNSLYLFSQTPPTPTIMVNGSATICPGSYVNLASSASAGNLWSTGDTTQWISVNTPGTYTVMQVSGNNSSAPSAPVVISLHPFPTVTLMPAGPFCKDAPPVVMQVSLQGGTIAGPAVSGFMFMPASANLGNNNIIIYKYCQSFGADMCCDTSVIRIAVLDCYTALDENGNMNPVVSVYPDSDGGQFIVNSTTEPVQGLFITGLDGKQLLSTVNQGENKIRFNLQAYPPGIYIARIQLQSHCVRLRFVKAE